VVASADSELSAHPELEVRDQLLAWSKHTHVDVGITTAVRQRADELVLGGFKSLDAAHIAFAEAAGCKILLTCDDRMRQRSQKLNLLLRVVNPVEYMQEMRDGPTND
jgi:predicted nucleic acid-binding protein